MARGLSLLLGTHNCAKDVEGDETPPPPRVTLGKPEKKEILGSVCHPSFRCLSAFLYHPARGR